uniref:Uncharacterized protein n=1 Tax=Leersia perrieri TaxID=77586 RepID=A0A0D9X1Q5_9ORYZ
MGGGSRNNNGAVATEATAAAAASGTATTVVALVLLLVAASVVVLLLSPTPTPTPTPAVTRIGDGGEVSPREPVEHAIGLAGYESWLDAVRAWAKLAFLKLRPPEPRSVVLFEERRGGGNVYSHDGGVCVPRYHLRRPASVKVKAAAKETLEMGKETVEHAAESAAETLGKTTVKLKRKLSPSSSPPAGRLDGDL